MVSTAAISDNMGAMYKDVIWFFFISDDDGSDPAIQGPFEETSSG